MGDVTDKVARLTETNVTLTACALTALVTSNALTVALSGGNLAIVRADAVIDAATAATSISAVIVRGAATSGTAISPTDAISLGLPTAGNVALNIVGVDTAQPGEGQTYTLFAGLFGVAVDSCALWGCISAEIIN